MWIVEEDIWFCLAPIGSPSPKDYEVFNLLTLLTRFVKESRFSDKSVVTMATGIVNTLFSGVHEQ